ncbi:MAG: EF-hand domain-containing protein [Gemmataceae bacterium]
MPSDDEKRELKEKIEAFIRDRHAGDPEAAFRAYADGAGLIDRTSLKNLLHDAGVGNHLTRGAWADGILEAVDTDRDRKISWPEFVSVYRG